MRKTRDRDDIAWRAAPLQVRDAGESELPTLVVYAVEWGSRNSYAEVFVPGCFADSLKAKSERKPLVMGLYHELAIGKWITNREDNSGLRLEGPISDTSDGRDAATLVRDGALTGVSIGFYELQYQYAEPGEAVSFDTPIGTVTYEFPVSTWYVLKADVVEASLVMAPSDDEARVVEVRAREQATRALPALRADSDEQVSWEDAAYSMALLMGGRGAGQFADITEQARRALYERLAAIYTRHAKTAPDFTPTPDYDQISFREGERELFHDRYLRKSLDAVIAGASGASGPLSAGTREAAQHAVDALEPLTRDPRAQLAAIRDELHATTSSLKG